VQRFRDGQLDMAVALTGASSVSDAAPAVLRVMIEALGWSHAELWLIDEVSDTLNLVAHATAHGLSLEHLLDFHVLKGVGVTGTVWATGAPVWVPDIGDDPHVITQESLARAQALSELGVRTVLAVPVLAGDSLLGVLNCYAAGPEEDQDSLTVLLAGAAAQLGQFLALRRSEALAAELGRAKDDFLTLLGHEMRTPLTSISACTDMLLDEHGLDPDTGKMIEVVARNTGTLRGIVDDLLDLAALESGHEQLSTAEFDLAGITADAAAAAGSPAGVHLHPDLPAHLMVHGDAHRLRQVIDALLSNAVKYSPGGGHIHIRLTVHDDVAQLSVTDAGIGIPADDHDRLFDRFYRAGNARHSVIGGSGLGLTRARIIVEAHHGTITVATHRQRPGTTVTVRLPRYSGARPR
jgi:signal transduction histidine kinase